MGPVFKLNRQAEWVILVLLFFFSSFSWFTACLLPPPTLALEGREDNLPRHVYYLRCRQDGVSAFQVDRLVYINRLPPRGDHAGCAEMLR
jgi:hypothetical protein